MLKDLDLFSAPTCRLLAGGCAGIWSRCPNIYMSQYLHVPILHVPIFTCPYIFHRPSISYYFSGMTSTFFTYPLDVINTRMAISTGFFRYRQVSTQFDSRSSNVSLFPGDVNCAWRNSISFPRSHPNTSGYFPLRWSLLPLLRDVEGRDSKTQEQPIILDSCWIDDMWRNGWNYISNGDVSNRHYSQSDASEYIFISL